MHNIIYKLFLYKPEMWLKSASAQQKEFTYNP